MEVTFLGTGTSQGVPMIACDCAVCTSDDPRDKRTRCCIHVVMDGLHIQVDASSEFRLRCVEEKVNWIDFFILTHGHADHIVGMDDLRRFCDMHGGEALQVYSTNEGIGRVKSVYPYAISERPISRGYAAFKLELMPAKLEMELGTIESTLLPHGGVNTLGLVFTERSSGKKFTYYTDCKEVPDEAIALARGSDVVVLDGLRPTPHPSHMTIGEATEIAAEIGAPLSYLTHLTHLTSHAEVEEELPESVRVAYDGLKLNL